MGLFNFHRNKKQVNPVISVLNSELYRKFDELFQRSLRLKNVSALASALLLRRQGTEIVKSEPALYCLGKHNEMILEYNHIGWGTEARFSALESIKYEDDYKNFSSELFRRLGYSVYEESIGYLFLTSTSYDECFLYLSKLREGFPNEMNQRRFQEISELKAKYSRWFTTHRIIISTLYSRADVKLDKGQYAAGLSVLDTMLSNAEKPGYTLSYEEYVDLLDDMCALAIKLFLEKSSLRQQNAIDDNFFEELGCILEKPVKYLASFTPDCLPKDKGLFNNYFQTWKTVPWISRIPGWTDLSSFFE